MRLDAAVIRESAVAVRDASDIEDGSILFEHESVRPRLEIECAFAGFRPGAELAAPLSPTHPRLASVQRLVLQLPDRA